MELSIGTKVIMTNDDGGQLEGVVERFERDGAQALIMPTDPVMKAWYPKGYILGTRHWDANLTVIQGDEKGIEQNGSQART